MADLTQDSQFEALLLRCQQEIQRWHENGGQFFADAMPAEEVREKMKRAAEPIYLRNHLSQTSRRRRWLC